jgi:hypothetical protein
LFKALKAGREPAGLYPGEFFFMEAKDMEGFNAVFTYGFIQEPCVFHPNDEGKIVHPYDEVLVFGGLKSDDILYFGAEASIEIGEGAAREEYIFAEPTVVTIPKGVPYGPIRFRRVMTPVALYTVGLAPEYEALTLPPDESSPRALDTKYAHLVKKLIFTVDDELIGTGMGYEHSVDERGVMDRKLAPKQIIGPGNGDELIWMFGKDLEGFDVNLTWGLYSQAGKWHREGEIHTHPEEEILVMLGKNPDDLHDFGAEIEIGMGPDAERNLVSVPTIAVCPKGFPHLPMLTRWADKPYIFVVICLSAEHASPWEYEPEFGQGQQGQEE